MHDYLLLDDEGLVVLTLCPLDMTLAGHVVERRVCRLAALLRAEDLDAVKLVGVAEAHQVSGGRRFAADFLRAARPADQWDLVAVGDLNS